MPDGLKKTILYLMEKKFFRFALSGAMATLIDVALLFIITEYLKIWYLISSIFSFLAGSISHFAISRHWVFKNKKKTFWRQYASFFVIHLGGISINTAALYALVEYAGIYYIAAKIITVLIGVSWTFYANKKFTFKDTDQ